MNRVFRIERVSHHEQTYLYDARIEAVHPIFKGHFPQMPVVPGVCTMSMIKECVADAISRNVRYDYIKECKFLSAISPSTHTVVQVSITLKEMDGQMSLVALVTADEVTMIKLRATLL